MAKPFFEVFPTLELKEDLRDMMECTQISKVSTNPKRDAIRIHINSKILIQKDHIFLLERSIKDQLFPNVPMLIKIYEKYELSDQYTPRKLMEIYHNSILDELREYSMVEYNLFRKAKWEFVEEQIMVLHLEQTVVAASKTDELVRILEKIFHERCGFPVQVRVEFEEVKPSKYREQSDQKIRQEVANIASVIQGAKGPEKDPGVQEQQGHQGHQGQQGQQGRKGREDRQDTSFRRAPRGFKRSDNPDVLYGRDFEEDAMPIEQLVGEIGEVVLRGQIMTLDTREIRNEKTIIIFSITDFTDSINVKMFVKNDELSDILEGIKKGAFIKIKGVSNIDRFDGELSIASVVGIKSIADFRTGRMDVSPVKRVELHCHTKMSDMDGVSDVGDIIKQAVKWGHKAVAITDHGVVQSFPEANHAIPKDSDFKIIYGMEAYLVDDLKEIVTDSRNQSLDDTYVVFDLETTGFSPVNNRIIEIGAVKVVEGKITDRFSTFVNPDVPIPFDIEKLTGINDHMVLDAPMIDQVLPEFLAFCEGAVMVAHNAGFDMSFVLRNAKRMGISLHKTVVDTVSLARVLLPQLNRFKLDTVAKALNISLDNHHRAVDDAACTAEIFLKFVEMLKNRDVTTLDGVNSISTLDHTAIKKLPTYHAIILARNDVGRVNLYRLVSMSHIDYYAKRPRVPKSLFMKYREGLLIGSACEAGELYQALLRESPQEEIARLAQLYDLSLIHI